MKKLRPMALSLALLPIAAAAQTNVKRAFDNIIENPRTKVEIVENHSLERNPQTGQKESQCDSYSFTMPKKMMPLITELEKAFRKDSQDAYNFSTGTRGRNSNERAIAIAVGDGGSGVTIGTKPGMKYMYACFLAPEDTAGNHRYAYAVEWQPSGNGDYIVGSMYVTYATTQKHRQEKNMARFDLEDYWKELESLEHFGALKDIGLRGDLGKLRQLRELGKLGKLGELGQLGEQAWFDSFMSYINSMGAAKETQVSSVLASKIYGLTKNLEGVDEKDKKTARDILEIVISGTRENVVKELLTAAYNNLK